MNEAARVDTAFRTRPEVGSSFAPGLNDPRAITAVNLITIVATDIAYPSAKRAFDVLTSALLLVCALPVALVIAIVVALQGGPVFFQQERIGTGGRSIWITKFRTMAVDAESLLRADHHLYARYVANGFKLPANDDPRITRFGRFLRASSLDELPQLWCVLRGQMAMVGPRPVVPPELSEYRSRGAEEAYLCARPGLTGLWQVSGRSNLGYDQRIALDLEYLKDPSVLSDLQILVRSVPAVVRRVGAH